MSPAVAQAENAGSSPEASHEHDCCPPAGHHAGAASGSNDDGPPQRSCCELTGKADVKLDKGAAPDFAPVVVFADVQVPTPTSATRSSHVLAPVVARWHAPPLYLSHASFLI